MRPRFSIGCLLCVITAICLALGTSIALLKFVRGKYEFALIDCGQGREIVLTSDRMWENVPSIYYFVRVDGKVVIPTTYITNSPLDDPTEIRFAHHFANNAKLVGVTFADQPSDYIVVHDFATNASWPSGEHIPWTPELTLSQHRELRIRSREEQEQILNAERSSHD